jgi:hypothetical protein
MDDCLDNRTRLEKTKENKALVSQDMSMWPYVAELGR